MWSVVRSIRLRLLLWYAIVLSTVVISYALLLYYEVRAARLSELDAELETVAVALESSLRLFPRSELGSPPPSVPKGKGAWPKGSEEPILPRERFLAGLGPPGPPGSHPNLSFGVWRADGSAVKLVGLPSDAPRPMNFSFLGAKRFRDDIREYITFGPETTTILIARPAGEVLRDLNRFAWQLSGSGSAVLLIGLAGGWVLSRRIFRPVAAISKAASRISVTNLSERIDVDHIDMELAGLAAVLNETFDRLQAAFDRQARFTADASHELRTPLAVLRSQAELALTRPRSSEEYREALTACVRSAERMSDLVQRMLEMARADDVTAGMKRDRVEFARLVREIASGFTTAAESNGLTLTVDLVPAKVWGDSSALGQVVANLIANAIKYNKPNGRVRVLMTADLDSITLTIEDTGCGIAPADQPRVFERFYRADKARSRATGGAGLGLAICKVIVEAHGGTIDFQSVPGAGSIFRVRLPRTA